jgi:hypothetical protein
MRNPTRSHWAALAAVVAGCVDGGPATAPAADATTKARCDVGKRPNYFVPISPKSSPLAVIGCARLGVSDKRVEFSANAEPIGRKNYLCLNPAYRGRGQLGIYIPASCTPNPVSRRLAVVSVEIPRQAVRGYGLVVWGLRGHPPKEWPPATGATRLLQPCSR